MGRRAWKGRGREREGVRGGETRRNGRGERKLERHGKSKPETDASINQSIISIKY
jgi:hypothetical protein